MASVVHTGMNGAHRADPQGASRSELLAEYVAASLSAIPQCARWEVVPVDPRMAGPAVHVLSPSSQEPDGNLEAILRATRTGWSASIFQGVFPEDGAVFLNLGGPVVDQAAFEASVPTVATRFVTALADHTLGTTAVAAEDLTGVQAVLAAPVVDVPIVPVFED